MNKSLGINVAANFIFGLPEDTRESMRVTLDFAKRINAEWANFYAGMAYPGSKLYEMALEEGCPLPSSWSGFSQHSYDTLPLPTKYLSGEEVLAFRDRAFTEYFTDPDYLNLMDRKFGPSVVEHIKEMTTHRIVRKHQPDSG